MKSSMKLKSVFWGLVALSLTSCGKESSRPDSGNDFFGSTFGLAEPATIEQTMADDELATEEINAHVESAVDGLEGDMETADGASLMLSAEGKGRFIRFRKCTEEGDNAVVRVAHGLSFEVTRDLPNTKVTQSLKSVHKRTHTWSKEGSAVECHEGGKYPVVNFANLADMQLDMNFDRKHVRSGEILLKKSGVTLSRSIRVEASGTRSIHFDSVTDAGDNKVISKTMTMEVVAKAEAKNIKGKFRLLERNVEINDENPFEVDVERDASDLSIQSRTIKSGRVIATGKEGGRIEVDFVNVKYLPTEGCMPVSGTINGSFYKPESTTADRTFTISFSGTDAEVAYGDGKKRSFAPRGCWLDRPRDAGSISDESSEEAVETEIQ